MSYICILFVFIENYFPIILISQISLKENFERWVDFQKVISFTWKNLGLWKTIHIDKFDTQKKFFLLRFSKMLFFFTLWHCAPWYPEFQQLLVYSRFTVLSWKLILMLLLTDLGLEVKTHQLLQSPLNSSQPPLTSSPHTSLVWTTVGDDSILQ